MSRAAWAAVIFAAWGLALGWLVKREVFRPTSARLADAARAIPPGATYYRLDVGGQQIGFASSTIDTLGDSIRVDEVLVLEAAASGRLRRTNARSTAIVGRALRLRSLDVRFDGDLGQFTARGDVVGDSVLRLMLVSAGDTQTSRVPLPRPTVVPALLPLRLAFGGDLRSGTTRAARVFDPVLLTERDVRVTIARESTLVVPDSADFDSTAMAWIPVLFDTVPAFRLDLTSGDVTASVWVDAQGRVVRATNAVGFAMERSAFEIAYENFRRRDTMRLIQASARPSPGDVVAATALGAGATLRSNEVHELRLRVSGGGLDALNRSGGRQRLRGDTLVVERGPSGTPRALDRPPEPRDTLWLAPEPLVESENPRIRAQARLLVGRERDPARAAERIVRWVHGEVRKEVTEAAPSAVRVLETRRGDCNEHAVLFVALARAAGLPARTVAGLLYLNGRFYYHAWAEVYVGTWVEADPLLGQFPADAGRVRIVVGGLARQVELLRLVGKLKLEVL